MDNNRNCFLRRATWWSAFTPPRRTPLRRQRSRSNWRTACGKENHEPIQSTGSARFSPARGQGGAAIVAAGGAGLWLHDRKGPSASIVSERCPCGFLTAVHRAEVEHRHRRGPREDRQPRARGVGGIERFIKSATAWVLESQRRLRLCRPRCRQVASRILVAEVARLCLHAGAASVIVTDNPINDSRKLFLAHRASPGPAEAAGAKIALPTPSSSKPTTLADAAADQGLAAVDRTVSGAAHKLIGSRRSEPTAAGASLDDEKLVCLGWPAECFSPGRQHHHFRTGAAGPSTLVILRWHTTMMPMGPTGGSLERSQGHEHDDRPATDAVAADASARRCLETAASLPFIGKAAAASLGTPILNP